MDFVVSKVAMAVCALLVVAVLAQAFDGSRFLENDDEIKRILSRFCTLLEVVARSESELELTWEVPMMPTGAELRLVVDGSLVSGESGGFRAYAEPVCELHTWAPAGGSLNRSIVESMDRSAPVLEAVSGQVLRVSSTEFLIDNSEELLVFVGCQVQDPSENLTASSLTESASTSASSAVL